MREVFKAWADFVQQVVTETEPGIASLGPFVSISLAEPMSQAIWNGRNAKSPWWSDASENAVRRLQQQARETFDDDNVPLARRTAAAGLHGWDASQRSADFDHLAAMLDPRSPPAIQQRVIAVLARTGPPLSESKNKSWAALLDAVFDPNRAVDQRYGVYVVASCCDR